jgi:hypothetical protein
VTLRAALLLLAIVSAADPATPQTADDANRREPDAPSPPHWSIGASADTYFLPHQGNYVQPDVTADRDALHLEGRYNYEERGAGSAFIGWMFEAGTEATLELTPMFGGVVGKTNGVVPALEFALSWGRLEVDSDVECVIALDDTGSFLYNVSEVSVRVTGWLRGGVTTQRTRALHSPREIQRGVLAGVKAGKIEGVFSLFNPGSSDAYVIASVRVSF